MCSVQIYGVKCERQKKMCIMFTWNIRWKFSTRNVPIQNFESERISTLDYVLSSQVLYHFSFIWTNWKFDDSPYKTHYIQVKTLCIDEFVYFTPASCIKRSWCGIEVIPCCYLLLYTNKWWYYTCGNQVGNIFERYNPLYDFREYSNENSARILNIFYVN